MATPLLSQVLCSAVHIRANFAYEDPTQEHFQIALFEGTRVTPSMTATSGPFVAILRDPPVTSASIWSVAVAAVIDGVVQDYSNRVYFKPPSQLKEVDSLYIISVGEAMAAAPPGDQADPANINKMPVITSAISSSVTSVNIAWDPPQTPGNIQGYQPALFWQEGSAFLDELSGTLRSATLTIPSTVPNGAWIRLAVVTGNAVGPFSESVPFVADVASGLTVNYDGTTISAGWKASQDARVNSYEVTFEVKDQPPVVETVYTNSWSKTFAGTAGQVASVSVRMVAGFSRSPATNAVFAILGQPSITNASFNGSQLSLWWSAVTDTAATEYIIAVLSNGKVMAEYRSGGTSATIPYAAGANTIQIRAVGPNTIGPFSSAFTPITQTPKITSVSSDVFGFFKISWDPISGAGKYKVMFSLGNDIKQARATNTNSLTIRDAELSTSGVYEVTVQPIADAVVDNFLGPVSLPVPMVVVRPPKVNVAYDGRTALVAWEPIVSPVITGYVTTILNGQTTIKSAASLGPTTSINLDYTTDNLTIVVQAQTNAGGGQPSTPVALFKSGWYPSTATNAAANIIPAKLPAMSSYDIVVYLPNIFTTYVSTGLPTDPPFVFSTTDPPYSYKLTIPANSIAWNFNADSIRADIVTAYQTLLTKLVQLKVTPLGWRMVQDAISRSMPQTFAETLFYAFAFVPGDGYVDLKPGMLLRVDFESYQYLGPDQNLSKFVNGFVSASSAFYDVGSYVTANNQWLNGFDAFLSLVTQSGSSVPPPQTQGSTASGGGGIVDLYYAQFRKPYVRLVYPPQIPGDSTADAVPSFNVAVLAANDYPTLATATQNLRNALPLPNDVAATYLRGRTIMSACIRVWLDGQPLVVPVGTTVGNVVENMARRPPIVIPQSGNPGIPINGLTVERSIGYAVSDPNDYSTSRAIPIRLDWNKGMAYSATTDWLSLPLLPGDHITTRGN